MNFDWNEFEKGKIAVHCNTYTKALNFLNKCTERNYKGSIYPFLYNKAYNNGIIYDYYKQRLNHGYNIDYYISAGYEIIEWEIEEEIFKAWELQEDNLYIDIDKKGLYKIKENNLLCYINNEWVVYDPYYSEIKNMNFIIKSNEKEIDWRKVPRMTKVQVYKNGVWHNKYFCGLSEDNEYLATDRLDDDYIGFKSKGFPWFHCRINPSVKIPEEWYKEKNNE